ncbi:hypothetical protein H4CHR_00567 [Variovorax sp. PBS-H4]|nr:hypothetical protein H4CHR_00567 [Variovorax sp. PBS-H4]
MLPEAGGADGEIARAREMHKSLTAFIRSLVGLDRETAKHARQVVRLALTDIHAQGPEGVFALKVVEQSGLQSEEIACHP